MLYRNLEAEHVRKGVKYAEVAAYMGMERLRYYRKRAGKEGRAFTIEEARKLAKFFGTSIDYLFEREDEDGNRE